MIEKYFAFSRSFKTQFLTLAEQTLINSFVAAGKGSVSEAVHLFAGRSSLLKRALEEMDHNEPTVPRFQGNSHYERLQFEAMSHEMQDPSPQEIWSHRLFC